MRRIEQIDEITESHNKMNTAGPKMMSLLLIWFIVVISLFPLLSNLNPRNSFHRKSRTQDYLTTPKYGCEIRQVPFFSLFRLRYKKSFCLLFFFFGRSGLRMCAYAKKGTPIFLFLYFSF